MDVSDQDRITPARPQSRWRRPALLALAILLLATGYYIYQQSFPDAVEPPASTGSPISVDLPPIVPAQPKAADIPQQTVQQQEQEPSLPSLADSDDFLRLHWQDLGLPDDTQAWSQGDFLLQRATTFIDGLAKGAVLRKFTPLDNSPFLQPKPPFKVIKNNGEIWLDETNFDRYKPAITFLVSMQPEHLAQLFHWLRPLLEAAYGELGQPPEQFGNQLITGLGQILATPDIDAPIKLKRESVLYQFADPAFESLPDVQKLLLRIGPQNRQQLKDWSESLKNALLAEQALD